MDLLRAIDQVTGEVRHFDLEPGRPVLIGSFSLEEVLAGLREIIKKVPDRSQRIVCEYIDQAKTGIVVTRAGARVRQVSRAHCMVFPGETPQVVDLFSANGTMLGRQRRGFRLEPGRKVDLRPNDIILLAGGRAIFTYQRKGDKKIASNGCRRKPSTPDSDLVNSLGGPPSFLI